MRELLRRLRGGLTGLNAISARFDLLQNRLDALSDADRRRSADAAELLARIATAARRDEVAELQGGLKALVSATEALSAALSAACDTASTVRRDVVAHVDARLALVQDRTQGQFAALQGAVDEVRAGMAGLETDVLARLDGQASDGKAATVALHDAFAGVLDRLSGIEARLDARRADDRELTHTIQRRLEVLTAHAERLISDQQAQGDVARGHDAALAEVRSVMDRLDARIASSTTRGQGLAGLHAAPRWGQAASSSASPAGGASQPQGARLAFLLHSLELVNHFSAVWDVLPPGSFDVVVHGLGGDISTLVARWGARVVDTSALLASGRRYPYLVSNHPVEGGEPPLIKRLADVNVRFMYAAGKSGWNLSDWNRWYDIILCFGPYHAEVFSRQTDAVVVQMGYPRFDPYFNTSADRSTLCRRFDCDPAREVVVWLPTWKELSSVGVFDEEIAALCGRYNVVVKLHPLMPISEPERVAPLRQLPFARLITDSSDNLPLYQLADYMLFDYGGPPLAGVYTDKNMVLLDVPGAEQDPLTGHGSPDVEIRAHLGSVQAGRGALAFRLGDMAYWAAQVSVRRALRRRYFAPHFGFAATVAANALLNLDVVALEAGARPAH